jgi:hypothetical protein
MGRLSIETRAPERFKHDVVIAMRPSGVRKCLSTSDNDPFVRAVAL